jgi:selenophosphate synthase
LSDPQTSGGLLLAVDPSFLHEVEQVLGRNDIATNTIGTTTNTDKTSIIAVI